MSDQTIDKRTPTGHGWLSNALRNELRRRSRLVCPDGTLRISLGPDGWMLQGAPAGDGGYLVQITGVHPDSPVGVGDVRIYRGNVYDNGWNVTPIATDVTIIATYMRPDQVIPPGPATRTIAARKTGHSWTDNLGNTVTEDVYYIREGIVL